MDTIFIIDDDGNRKPMEAVSIYEMPNSSFHYVIYRSFDYQNYYVGKYLGEDIVDLNTELSVEEMKIADEILKGVMGKEYGIENGS